MNRTKEDKLIKNKLDAMTPLSGGVVFGKEEAWDRLQSRMDSKPARKIPVIYWRSAAAILLILISALALYNRTPKPIAKHGLPLTPALIKLPATPTNTKPVISVDQNTTTTIRESHVVAVSNAPVPQPSFHYSTTQIVATDSMPPLPPDEPATHYAVGINPVEDAPKPYLAHLPVVHINDLEHNAAKKKPDAIVLTDSRPDFRSIPIMHIKDVEQTETDIRQLLHDNRLSFGRYRNVPPIYDEPAAETEQYPRQNSLLKNFLKIQN